MISPKHYRKWCRDCGRYVLAPANTTSVLNQTVLILLTCGLWLPVTIVLFIRDGLMRPALCPRCGARC